MMINMTKERRQTINPYHPKYWLFWCGIGIFYLLHLLPFNIQIRLGKLIGSLLYRFSKKSKQVAKVNIQLCLPALSEKEQETLLHKNFQEIGIAIFGMGMAWWGSKKRLKNLLHFNGLEHLKKAQREGRAIILVGAHFTTLQIVGRLFSLELDIAIVYRQHKKPFINYLMENLIYRHQAQKIERDDLRGMLRVLKEKGMLWITADVDVGKKHHLFVPFFGTLAATSGAPSVFAKRSNATVLPVYFYRDKNNKYVFTFTEPPKNFPSNDPVKDMTTLNHTIEAAIQKNPAQYLWTYKRFKTRPDGAERFY